MKTLKKSLALVLALMMVVGVLAVGANAEFADAAQITPEYKEAVDVLAGFGVVAGIGNGNIAPKAGIERAQLAKILYEAYTGNSYTKAANYAGMGTFTDVSANAWYAGVVNYAAYKGWIRGYGDGKFGPKDNIIGYDALTMVLRMLGYGKLGELEGNNYRASAIEIAADKGMIVNTDKNNVNYAKTSTREEVFEYLYQAMQIPTVSLASKDAVAYTDGAELMTAARFENFEAAYSYAVVTGVPAVYPTALVDEDGNCSVYLNGVKTAVAAVEEFGPEYIGRVVKVLANDTNDKIFSMTVVSRDITVAEDAEVGEGKDYKDLDAFVAGLTAVEQYEYKVTLDEDLVSTTPADVNNAGTIAAGIYVVLDKDVIDDEIDGADDLADGAANVVTYIDPAEKYEISVLKVAEPAEGKAVKFGIDAEATNKTAEELDAWYETNIGITVENLKAGDYPVSVQKLGDITEYAILDVVAFDSITKVNTANGTTTFVADGKTYTVLADANVDVTSLTVVPAAVGKDNTTQEIVIFDGKAIVVNNMHFIPAAEETPAGLPAIDGFAKVLRGNVEIDVDAGNWLGVGAATTIKNAQVEVLLDNATVKVYDLDVKLETEDDVEKVNFYRTPDAKTAIGTSANFATLALNEEVYAYRVSGGKIYLYTLAEVGVAEFANTGDVQYDIDRTAVNKDTLLLNGINITKASIVAPAEEGYALVDINGVASTTGVITIVKSVYDADKEEATKTIVVIFAGSYTAYEAAEPAPTETEDVIYVDAASKTIDKTLDENGATVTVYSYDAYTVAGKKITVTGGESVAAGVYKLMSDNSIGSAATGYTNAAIEINDNVIKVGGTAKLLAAGYKTINVNGANLVDNAGAAVVHENANGEIDLIFVYNAD